MRRSDTLDEVLAAPDRDALLGWLIARPLANYDSAHNEVLVHAGLVPQWHAQQASQLASEVSTALQRDPRAVLGTMYGDEPDQWDEKLHGEERLRFIINVLTRVRVCTAQGRVDMSQKGPPGDARPPWTPWYKVPGRASASSRVIFGHWSALGLHRGDGVLALDTGCAWGGTLTAVNLDDPDAPAVAVRSRSPRVLF
jgi:bis(5'-nucleosyl)-tetraphosphatase (symmetrical)